jgi:zinc and cadmium transporter
VSTLAWIVISGVAMSAIALVGSVAVFLPAGVFVRVVRPLVALAAGSLLGGATFVMLPEAIDELGNDLTPWVWFAGGFVTFFLLEQFLQWHHCHQPVAEHRPLGHLILIADGLHNFLGGMAVAAAFLVSTSVGLVTWLAAAAHEVPQELGDFGILIHSGWSRRAALMYNVLSAATFIVGGLVAYMLSDSIDVEVLLPFAAGNFVYIAAADLIPELRYEGGPGERLGLMASFGAGLGILLGIAIAIGGP